MNIRDAVQKYFDLTVALLEAEVKLKGDRAEKRKLGTKIYAALRSSMGAENGPIKCAVGNKQIEVTPVGDVTVLSDLQEVPTDLEV